MHKPDSYRFTFYLWINMSEKELCSWLTEQILFYIPVTDQEGINIASLFKIRKINKGDYLLKEGLYGNWWGFVYKGLLRSYSFDNEGNDYTNGFFKESSFTCELVSFNGTAVSPTNVDAIEDTIIFCVDKQTLDMLFRDFPDFEKFGRLLYEKAFVSYKQHNLFRVRFNAKERYLHFLKNEPELIKRVPLKYIASYLNVTDTSLSRIRRNMR
jgi:CRP-like cAMP-binding protein